MSRSARRLALEDETTPTAIISKPVAGVDGAPLKGPATLTGLVRTTKGAALAIVVLTPDGQVQSIDIGQSQPLEHGGKAFVGIQHQRLLAGLAHKL